MKPIFFWGLKEISDLKPRSALIDKAKSKKEVEILVLDDNVVPFLDILKQNDYQIKQLNDITDLKIVEAYDIILCDIQGIGKTLSPQMQGAHIVKEIKKIYPFKQVIAFTASPSDPLILGHISKADIILGKDASEDQWIESLDTCIKKFSDPVNQWINLRTLLLNNGVTTKSVANLESDFVKAVTKNDPDIFTNSVKNTPEISKELWKVLEGVASLIKIFAV